MGDSALNSRMPYGGVAICPPAGFGAKHIVSTNSINYGKMLHSPIASRVKTQARQAYG